MLDLLCRSIARSAGVELPGQVRIVPPAPRRPGRLACLGGTVLGRAGRWLIRAGEWLAAGTSAHREGRLPA